MRMSLFYKLIGAFALVILLGAMATYFTAQVASRSQFQVFATRSGQILAQALAPELSDYYAQHRSWQGVDQVIQTGGIQNNPMTGMMQGTTMQHNITSNMWAMMGEQILLADSNGMVVLDNQGEWTGKQLTGDILAQGIPIHVQNQTVGTLIVGAVDQAGSNTPASNFLSSLNRSILIGIVLTSLVALGLGSLLFFNITAPVRQLTAATRSIAQGELGTRVVVRTKDELGALAQSFNEMADHLARAETQRRQVVADVAHELRNPLAVIQGNLEAILDGVVPLEMEQVASIHSETLLLKRMVEDLRLLSLAEAGQFRLEQQSIQIPSWLEPVMAQWKIPAHEKEVEIEATLEESVGVVRADPDRLAQVMNNLITNALRYTPSSGKITIRIEALATDPKYVRFSVTDTGLGIASEDLAHVFERFYQGDHHPSRQVKGSGLGLTIVKVIVEAHGGQVYAESPVFHEGNRGSFGTRIWFTLPQNNPTL